MPSGADRIPRWDTRPAHPAAARGERDFGTWHKETLARDAYCMDVDKVEYRIDPDGRVRVVGIHELIRWDWHHDRDDIPERLAALPGKGRAAATDQRCERRGAGRAFPDVLRVAPTRHLRVRGVSSGGVGWRAPGRQLGWGGARSPR